MDERSVAVLDEHGVVTNLITLNADSAWTPPPGHTLTQVTDQRVTIGDRFDSGTFTPTTIAPAPDLQAQIDALTELVLGGSL